MKWLTEIKLKVAPDYEELKWHIGVPVIIAAFEETWRRLTDTKDYTDNDYFVVADKNDGGSFFGTYANDKSIEPSN